MPDVSETHNANKRQDKAAIVFSRENIITCHIKVFVNLFFSFIFHITMSYKRFIYIVIKKIPNHPPSLPLPPLPPLSGIFHVAIFST